MNDFRVVKQLHFTLFIAQSERAKAWAYVNWNDNLKRVTVDLGDEYHKYLEDEGFTVGDK